MADYYKDSKTKKNKHGERDYSTSSLEKKRKLNKKTGDGALNRTGKKVLSRRERLQQIMKSM